MASPHDALFKYAFTDVEEARPLLRSVAPPELVAEIDWSTLEVAPGSFVDEALSNRQSDILYQALMGGEAVLLYLLVEHQSVVDRLMAYRMLRYVTRIWDRWLRDHDGARELPQVVPIVVYAGEPDWDAPTAVDTLVRGETRSWTAQMSFILDDLSRLTDEQLHARQLSVFAELAVLALARLRGSRDPLGLVESCGQPVLRTTGAGQPVPAPLEGEVVKSGAGGVSDEMRRGVLGRSQRRKVSESSDMGCRQLAFQAPLAAPRELGLPRSVRPVNCRRRTA